MIAKTRKQEFLSGVRAELPLLLGVVPFGMIYGALALKAQLPLLAAQGMSSILFSGSAQFIATQIIATGAPAAVIVLVVFVVNLRHALYSASVAPHLQKLTPGWKGLLAYLLTDEAYAVTIMHYNQESDPTHKHWFFLGAGLTLWTCWQASTLVGIFVGQQISASWPISFVLPLTFIALVVPALKDRANVVAAAIAALVGLLAMGLPLRTGLLLAALVGILAGLAVERRQP